VKALSDGIFREILKEKKRKRLKAPFKWFKWLAAFLQPLSLFLNQSLTKRTESPIYTVFIFLIFNQSSNLLNILNLLNHFPFLQIKLTIFPLWPFNPKN